MYKHSIYFVYILHIGSYIDGELHDVTILDVCVCVCVCDEWSPYDVAIAYYSP